MTGLPRIRITAAAGGWTADCDTCPWTHWHPRRPVVDQAAHHHRATHARKDTE